MITLVLLACVCAAGALLAGRLDSMARRWSDLLALGAATGLALFSGVGFVACWAFGMSGGTVVAAALLTTLICAGFGLRPGELRRRVFAKGSRGEIGLALLALIVVARIADRTLIETPQGLAIGDRHNYGDMPFHMAIAAGFAYGENFPPSHPELAGVPLTYPFLCDLLSAMALRVSGSWRDAFVFPTLILGLSMVVALVRFGESVTGSRPLGRIGAGLTVFSGGLGFWSAAHPGGLAQWWQSGPDLTMSEAGLRYANFVTTMFIPQRSILFGWPLLFFALSIMVENLKRGTAGPGGAGASRERALFSAGILGSLLPLVHSHSFAVLLFCSLFFVARLGVRPAAAFFMGLLPLAGPAVLFMLTHNSLSTGRFFEWHPWFDGGAKGPLYFWLMNAGVFLPLVGLGIAISRRAVAGRSVAVPFVALFALANMFRLSPWIWDNMKFLAPAHAGLAPFAAMALGYAWERGVLGRTAAAALFVVATLSGAMEVAKIAAGRETLVIFDPTAIAFAEQVKASTEPFATILTAPTHNHPVLLSGRRSFLGYEGHLWSQGLDYERRKPVADAIFHGAAPPADAARFIPIDAVAVTPAEAGLIPDARALSGLPSIVDSPYRLLKVR